VPFTEIQEQIRMNCPEDHFTLIMRRFMMRLAQRVADEVRAKALVTGECLGQVASQTMEALRVSEDVAELPVLRPLIGMDKEEIIRISRKIGTFDTSILPYEDCCTVFTPRHPKTKPHVEEVRELEAVRTSTRCATARCRAVSACGSSCKEPPMSHTAELIAPRRISVPTAMSSAVWDMGSLLNRQHGQRRPRAASVRPTTTSPSRPSAPCSDAKTSFTPKSPTLCARRPARRCAGNGRQ